MIFDGIDTDLVRPNDAARFRLPSGRELTRSDTVVTYIARNLEPYRGFPSFMRAVPRILARHPKAHVVIVGGDEVSYGDPPGDGRTWRETLLAEMAPLDSERIHFLGRVPYRDYLALLQTSTAHVYLTVPFVLSWSCMEALAAGCLVIGSRTPPVEEVIVDGHNGWLVDFFDSEAIARRVGDAIDQRDSLALLRARARQTVVNRYDLKQCLAAQVRLLASMV